MELLVSELMLSLGVLLSLAGCLLLRVYQTWIEMALNIFQSPFDMK